MQPSVVPHGDLLQLSYDLPHRASNAVVYPLTSSNGSTIILYGHEDGLRIIWYGGKPFKQTKTSDEALKTNGATKSEAMVIDLSDDEDEKTKQPTQPAEFEQDEAELDPKRPYPDVLKHINISLGTRATEIAVAPIQASNMASTPEAYPELLRAEMVVAVACADLSIRLVSLSLTPPSPDAVDVPATNLQLVKLYGSNSHRDFISSISITYTSEATEREADGNKSRSRSRGRSTKPGHEWSLLIASTSNTGSGLLLVHQVPIGEQHELLSSTEALVPIQRQYLRRSLAGCRLVFNPSPHPAERSTNLLLTLPSTGCVKLYQLFPRPSHSKDRRGSAATIDSVRSNSRSNRGPSFQQGKFLITLYAGFIEATDEAHSQPRRKRVLDAAWVLGGRGVLALLEDGEWGVWDLEAGGPTSSTTTPNLFKGHSKVADLQGGSLARFAIRSIVPPSGAAVVSATIQAKPTKVSGLAPMTPHTRKTRSEGLFQGAARPSAMPSTSTSSVCGSISVQELMPSTNTKSSTFSDESIILNYGETNAYLPSLIAFWRSATTGKGSFDSTSSSRLVNLPAMRLGSQPQRSIMQLSPANAPSGDMFRAAQSIPDVLITTDHRLVMLTSPLSNKVGSDNKAHGPLATRTLNADISGAPGQMLDIKGINKALSDMDGRQGMNVQHDLDIVMDSPTPSKGARSARTPLARLTSARARLFS